MRCASLTGCGLDLRCHANINSCLFLTVAERKAQEIIP